MSCLGIFCNYNNGIKTYEETAGSVSNNVKGPGWHIECQVECNSVHWTLLKKVTTLVIGFLAVLAIAAGGTLYAVGIINMKTAIGIMAGATGLLVVDLGVILYFRKKHALFLERVGLVISEYEKDQKRSFAKRDYANEISTDIEIKKTSSDDDKQMIVMRTGEYTFRVELYQAKEAYEKRKAYFEEKE